MILKKTVKWLIILFVLSVMFIFANREIQIYQKMNFVKSLGVGINIGNSLDAKGLRQYKPEANDLDFETSWGNPKITKEQLICIKEAGFNTVRIPVSWQDHMN